MPTAQSDIRIDSVPKGAAGAMSENMPDRTPEGTALISSFYQMVGITEPTEDTIDYEGLRALSYVDHRATYP